MLFNYRPSGFIIIFFFMYSFAFFMELIYRKILTIVNAATVLLEVIPDIQLLLSLLFAIYVLLLSVFK